MKTEFINMCRIGKMLVKRTLTLHLSKSFFNCHEELILPPKKCHGELAERSLALKTLKHCNFSSGMKRQSKVTVHASLVIWIGKYVRLLEVAVKLILNSLPSTTSGSSINMNSSLCYRTWILLHEFSHEFRTLKNITKSQLTSYKWNGLWNHF